MSRLGWLVTLALRTVSICCRYNYLLAEKMHKLKVENYYYYFFFENHVLFGDLSENYSLGDRLSDSWL